MPQLAKDSAALLVYGVRDNLPRFSMLLGVDLGRLEPAARLEGSMGAFGDDETSTSALCIVFGHELVGSVGGAPATTGHGGHDYAVREFHLAHADRRKKVWIGTHGETRGF